MELSKSNNTLEPVKAADTNQIDKQTQVEAETIQSNKQENPSDDAPILTEEAKAVAEKISQDLAKEPVPEIILATKFSEFNLSPAILANIEALGYEQPTPVQSRAIPVVLAGKDLVASSQTGTGKTAAFALGAIENIKPLGKPQILVLEPTRELAHQVAEAFEGFTKGMGLNVSLIYGGVGYEQQAQSLSVADIVVATPGRLVDQFFQGHMRFGEIKTLVLDEVDRMLDMGFLPIVKKIVNLCPWENRQTLFFSATMPLQIASLSKSILNNPEKIEATKVSSIADTIEHAIYPVASLQRDELFTQIIQKTDYSCAIAFTRTRKEADHLYQLLKKDLEIDAVVMHSDISQNKRTQNLSDFREGKVSLLIATNVAARGIDIKGVSHVINYQVPENPEDYVHRIGRTGRAQAEGKAYTLVSAHDLDCLTAVEQLIGEKIKREKLEGFNYQYTALLDEGGVKPVRKPRRPAPKRRRK